MTNFDAYAETYENTLSTALAVSGESPHYFARQRIRFLNARLRGLRTRPVRSILDFGCGVGSAVPLVRDEFAPHRVVGLDVSKDSLDVARQRYPGVAEFSLVHDYEPRQDIDLAFCNGVFHHIAPHARAGTLERIAQSLRPGGYFALWENNPWNPGARYVMAHCEFDRGAIMLSVRETVALIRAAGLHVREVRYMFIFPRALRALRWSEPLLSGLPLGAQYQVLSQRPEESRTAS